METPEHTSSISEDRVPEVAHRSQKSPVPPPTPIALPKTELFQADTKGNAGSEVYSQSIAGYVNAGVPVATANPSQPVPQGEQSATLTPSPPPAPTQPVEQIAPTAAGGSYIVTATPSPLPTVSGSNFYVGGNVTTQFNGGLAWSSPTGNTTWQVHEQGASPTGSFPPGTARLADGAIEESPFANRLQSTLTYATNGTPYGAATLARDGQMLYEMGKLDQAETKLGEALRLDPENRGAYYYLELTKQARYAREDKHKDIDNDDRMVVVGRAWEKPLRVVTNATTEGSGLADALAHATNGTPYGVQWFNFPDLPSSSSLTNAIAMANGSYDQSANKFGLGVQGSGQTEKRETVIETSHRLVAITPPPASAPSTGNMENEVAERIVELPSQSQPAHASQAGTDRDQSYYVVKRQLDEKMSLHNMLAAKIESDKSDSLIPKSSLVTVVEPADTAKSQNLWQRMTGTVESRASIEVSPDVVSDVPTFNGEPGSYAPYDAYFMETEVKSIQSDAVLGKVVDTLKLDQAWSKQDDGEKLSRKDAISLLKSRLDLQMDKNTKLIEIGAKSDKPDEAAKIANAVAEAYSQYRSEMHLQRMSDGIETLERDYKDEGKQIRTMQAELQQMQTPVSIAQANKPLTPPPANAPIPQPEILTRDNAFSTFSLNVSDVSFKLASVSLGNGQMPAPASIRSEEFINAFDYHDPEPLQGQPLSFVFERASDPFAQERDLLRFSVKAAALGRQEGRALNLVLLLDTSGSMERADRVNIIHEALRVLSAQLQPQDTVSVVTFAHTARLWADGVPGDQAGATLDKVGSITPEGGTNLEEAMRLAYETALRHFRAGGINRVVLLTDGAANLGNVDSQTLTQKVEAERRQGISLDCFGIGWEDYNDDLLEQLSSNGDGRYAFINSPDEAATEFAAKLAGALQVAAEDVKVQVEFNPDRVTAWRQIGYAKHQLTKEQFRDNSVAAGAIAAREAGNALYVIETNPDGKGPIATVRVRYRVPGTQENHERSWLVDYTGAASGLAQSSPGMRLAATAGEFSERLADSPFAQDVTLDELLNYLSGVPQFYNADERPKQLEWMIRQAKSVSGK